jgi:PEP-CTERM motif-containing protein
VKHVFRTAVMATVAAAVLGFGAPHPASGANFSICAYGTVNVSSCGSTDPQLVTATGATVGVIGNAGSGPLDPFLLFAIVPDLPNPPYPGSPAAAPVPGTSSTLSISLANQAYYGQTNTPANGYLGEFTSTSTANNIYDFAGLSGGDSSMNFSNLSGFSGEAALFGGVAPTSFSIYEYTVTVNGTTGNLPTSNVYNLPFSTLALGTYFAVWGIDANPATNGTTVYATPFTTSGFVATNGLVPPSQFIPEPASLALLGLGLAVAGAITWRRSRKRNN